MSRWLPFPRLSVTLLGLWLLLNQSVAPAHLLLGSVLAAGLPRLLAALLPMAGGLRRPAACLRLLRLVLVDILRSNVAVARLIAHPGHRKARATFLHIPLRLRNGNALAMLACILTSTPGTLWVDYDAEDGVLLLHVLDLVDDANWIRLIKHRYENLLVEIFE